MPSRPDATAYLVPAGPDSGPWGSAGDGDPEGSGGRVPAGLGRVDELGDVTARRADGHEPRLRVVGDDVRVETVDAAAPGRLDGVDEVVLRRRVLGVELGDAARLQVVAETLEVVERRAGVVDGGDLGDGVALDVDEERVAEQVDLRVPTGPGDDG